MKCDELNFFPSKNILINECVSSLNGNAIPPNIFESFDCEALFMSTHSTDGYNCMPKVEQWVKTINVSGRYLNSGVYIGKTSFVKEMIKEAMKYAIPHGVTMDDYREYLKNEPFDYPKGSQDQDIFRYIEPKFYPKVKVDYQNKMAYRS